MKYVLIFSTTVVWNISHFKSYWARYDQKCISVFMQSTHYSCQILMNSNRNRKGMAPKWAEATQKKNKKKKGMHYTQLLTHLTLLFFITSLAFMRAS